MEIRNKKTFFLLSFGHCGIDWTHALLTSHASILILPAFSFYRGWNHIMSNQINLNSVNLMISAWKEYLDSDYSISSGGRFFTNKKDNNLFYDKFRGNLELFGLDRLSIFYALHDAYAKVKNIEISSIDVIVEHEHVCFNIDLLFQDFKSINILLLVRDPRSAIAGYYRGIERKCVNNSNCYHHQVSKSWAEWKKASQIYYKYRYYQDDMINIIKYEDLVQNIDNTTKKIAQTLGITFNRSLTIPLNADGSAWRTDTCYISRNDPDVDRKIFFTMDNIEKRWMSVLNKRDILSIETVFSKIMITFDYKKIYKPSIKNKILGFLLALYPKRGINRYSFYSVNESEKKINVNVFNLSIIRYLVKFSPLLLLSICQYFLSFLDNIRIIIGIIPKKYK
jgi:hypothetical protein